MNVLRGGLVALGTCSLAAMQYLLPAGWRYALLSVEFAAVAVAVVNLFGQVKVLTRQGEEHRARLNAIAEVAEHGIVVAEASAIVDSALFAPGPMEPVDSTE